MISSTPEDTLIPMMMEGSSNDQQIQQAGMINEELETLKRKEELDKEIDGLFLTLKEVFDGNMKYQYSQMELYETMVTLIASKYNLTNEKADETFVDIQRVNEEFKKQEIKKYLHEVDVLENNVKSLAGVVEFMDHKSKELVKRFKQFL